MIDIILSVFLAIFTAILGYLGVHSTLHPPLSQRKKTAYKLAFGIIVILSIGLIIWQGVRTQNSQEHIQADVIAARDDARSARDESKSSRAETDKLRTELTIEAAKREQAQKDMAMIVQKASAETRTGVAEDFRKSPIKIDVAPGKEALKISINLMQATAGDNPPYETKFLATVNQIVTPIRLVVQCESEILQAHGDLVGVGVTMGGGWGGRFSKNQFGIGISSPAWSPSTPMIITVKSNQKPLGVCGFTNQ